MPVDTTIILRRDTALNLWAPTALADTLGYLKNDGAGNLTWGPGGSGITGPVSSTVTALVRWDNALGTAVRDSNVTLANSGTALAFSGAGGISAGGSNQNVTLTPSGTGKSVLAGPIQLLALTAGFVQSDASGNLSIGTPGGTGDFSGPTSATDNAAVRFDGTTGKLGQNSIFIIDDSGNVSDGGTLPASTMLYFERSGLAIGEFKSTGNDARLRLRRADNSKGAMIEFLRGTTDEFYMGTPFTGGTPDGTGNEFVINYFDSSEHTLLALNTVGALQLKHYLTTGLLSNDTSGNVTTTTVGPGLSLSAGVLSTSGGGSGTVNSGTATQVAYYASTGTAVSSSGQFTVGASGNPGITAAGTNQNITLTPSGTGVTSSPSGAIFNTVNSDARILFGYQFSSPQYYPGIWFGPAATSPSFSNYTFLSSNVGETFFQAAATKFIDFGIGGVSQVRVSDSGSGVLFTASGTNKNIALTPSGTGVVSSSTSFLSGNPSGGTAAAFKMGSVTSIAVPSLALNYLQVDVAGVAYKIALLT